MEIIFFIPEGYDWLFWIKIIQKKIQSYLTYEEI